ASRPGNCVIRHFGKRWAKPQRNVERESTPHPRKECYLGNSRLVLVPFNGASLWPITLVPLALRVLRPQSQIKARAWVIRPIGDSAVGFPLSSTLSLLAV